jgi:hypothetical protein
VNPAWRYLARGGGWWALKRAQYAYARLHGFRPLEAFWMTYRP